MDLPAAGDPGLLAGDAGPGPLGSGPGRSSAQPGLFLRTVGLAADDRPRGPDPPDRAGRRVALLHLRSLVGPVAPLALLLDRDPCRRAGPGTGRTCGRPDGTGP